jgi:hypothetical protein
LPALPAGFFINRPNARPMATDPSNAEVQHAPDLKAG